MIPLDNVLEIQKDSPPFISDSGIILELHVPDVEIAVDFFLKLNFLCINNSKNFSVVKFGSSIILLGRKENNYIDGSIGEIRILVKDVDNAYLKVCENFNLNPKPKLFNAKYGLREFVINSPFGIHIRISSIIADTD